MPVIDVTKTKEYKEIAMKMWVNKHLPQLKELGYTIEKDGYNMIEYMAHKFEFN